MEITVLLYFFAGTQRKENIKDPCEQPSSSSSALRKHTARPVTGISHSFCDTGIIDHCYVNKPINQITQINEDTKWRRV